MNTASTETILVLVDDDDEDAMMLRSAAARVPQDIRIVHLSAGEALLSAVRKGGLPDRCLVLLDLNMPEMDGFTVLDRVRAIPEGHLLPVVVYTTTSDQPQVDRAYASGANAFLTKPTSLRDTTAVIEALVECWFHHGRLPRWGSTAE